MEESEEKFLEALAEISAGLEQIHKTLEGYKCKRCEGSGRVKLEASLAEAKGVESEWCPACKGKGY